MRKMKLAGLLESFGTSSWRNTTSLMDTLNSKEMKIVLKLLVSHMTIIQENGIQKKVVTYGSLGDVLKMESIGSSFRVLANIEDVLKENLVISLTINWPSEDEYINLAKSSLRRAVCVPKVITAIRAKTDSNKTVEAVILLIIDEDGKEVSTTNTVAAIKGNVLDESLPDKLAPALAQDFADIPSKSKKIILTNLVKKTLQTQPVDEDGIKLGDVTSSQVEEYLYGVEADDIKPVGKPFPLAAGLLMASGEASYVDDFPKLDNELYMKFVTGQRGHAKILNVDASKALEMPGVAKFISIADIPEGKNEFATFGDKDANVFADGEVLYWGHPVGAILADTAEIATKAASLVEIEYEDLPVIVTIQDAIKAESFYANPEFFETAFTDGDAKKTIDESPHIIEGSSQTPRQEHFYEETYNVLAVPQEDGEMKVYTSSQFVTGVQLGLANILGVPANRITIICKRIGCSYGGKCFRNYGFVFAGALAAQLSGRPVRCVLNREEDMQQSGQRGEFEAKYRVGVDNDGKLTGLEYNLWKNGGWCSDCSVNILEYALFHGTNCYKFPTFKGVGKVCKTKTPSNTAFRGYGSPQGLTITENIMFEIAEHLDLDPVEFRRKNFLVVGDKTHYGQIQKEDDVKMEACMDECIRKSQYQLSKEAVDQFHSTNKHRKRGICLIPQKYGVGIVPMFAQAGALINVHLDGSVNLYVGGVEMGNGFYTKMVQVASNELGIPMSKIHI